MTRFSNWDCREKRTQGLKWEDRGWTHSSSGSHIESLCGAEWLAHFSPVGESCRAEQGRLWISQGWQWRRPCKCKVFSTSEQKVFMVNSMTRRFSLLFVVLTMAQCSELNTQHGRGNKMATLSAFRTSRFRHRFFVKIPDWICGDR